MLNELKNIGLSENEARMYLSMLELGPASMQDVALKAGVNRPTAYAQLESLKKMGLASTQTRGKKHLYIAESPSQLAHILTREKKELEHKNEILKKTLPDLTTLFNLGEEKPVVRYFEGKEGVLHLRGIFLKSKAKEIHSILPLDLYLHVFPGHIESPYSKERSKRKIHSRLIYTSRSGPVFPAYDKNLLREAKYFPPHDLPLSVEMSVFGNTIAIVSLAGKTFGILMESKETAGSFRAFFMLLWEKCKTTEKN